MKKEIVAPALGENHGPYSHGIQAGNTVYSTQVGNLLGPGESGEIISDSVYEQTKQTIKNIQAVLDDCGGTLDDIVKVTIYIIHLKENFAEMNRAYKEMMPSPYPARACVEVLDLPDDGAKVEMEFTIHLG